MIKKFTFALNKDTVPWFADNYYQTVAHLDFNIDYIRDRISNQYAMPLTDIYNIIFNDTCGDYWNCMEYFVPKQLVNSIKYSYDEIRETYTVCVTAIRWDDRVIFEDKRIIELIEEGEENDE